jgi:hypothetical protein
MTPSAFLSASRQSLRLWQFKIEGLSKNFFCSPAQINANSVQTNVQTQNDGGTIEITFQPIRGALVNGGCWNGCVFHGFP